MNFMKNAGAINEKLKNSLLIVKVTRPTTVAIMELIKNELKYFPTIILQIDYANLGFKEIIKEDSRKYNIGLLILTKSMFKDLYKLNFLLELKIPIFKMGEESLKASKNVGRRL